MTRSLRSKEDAHDYRYFPDPDLLPLELDEAFLEECRASLPELPDAKRKRYEGAGHHAYNAERADRRGRDRALVRGAARRRRGARSRRANWVVAELFGALNRRGETIDESPVAPGAGGRAARLVADGTISGTIAKQVFEIMLETGEGAGAIVEERGLKQTSDTGAIEPRSTRCSPPTPTRSPSTRRGKEALFGFFVGQTMKAMAGKANPQVVNERLRAKLDG